jgi:hypothetical protein
MLKFVYIFLLILKISVLNAQDLQKIAKYQPDVYGTAFELLGAQYLDLNKVFRPSQIIDISSFLAVSNLDYIKIEKLYYGAYGNAPLKEEAHTIEYIYFDKNKYVRAVNFSANLSAQVFIISDKKYEYDSKDRLTMITDTRQDTNYSFKNIEYIGDSITIIKTKYDTTIIHNNKDNLPFWVDIFMVDYPNLLNYNDLNNRHKYEYDEKNNLIRIETCGQNHFFKYNDNKLTEFESIQKNNNNQVTYNTKMLLSADKKKATIAIKSLGGSPSDIEATFNKSGFPTFIKRQHKISYEPFFVREEYLIRYNAENYPLKIVNTVFFKQEKKPFSKYITINTYDDKNLLRRREINFKKQEDERSSRTIITITPNYK